MVTARRDLNPLPSRPENSGKALLLFESLAVTYVTNIAPFGSEVKEVFR
jgi:hypothetical protein